MAGLAVCSCDALLLPAPPGASQPGGVQLPAVGLQHGQLLQVQLGRLGRLDTSICCQCMALSSHGRLRIAKAAYACDQGVGVMALYASLLCKAGLSWRAAGIVY